jgi:predicted ferric reductase
MMTEPSLVSGRAGPQLRRSPLPRRWPVASVEILILVAVNAVVIVGMWVRHGGIANIADAATMINAAGQLTALLGTYLALLGLLLVSRSPWLDQLFGTDRLIAWHRWVGFATVWLLVAHTAFTTIGYAGIARTDILGEWWALLGTYPFVLMATVGLVMMVVLAATSVRAARRSLSYETWYGIHLYGYLAVALAFAHELAVGTDFASDTLAQAYWIALYVVVIACLLAFRVGQPLRLFARHRFRVANLVEETPGVISVYITGRNLDTLPVRAGQFFVFRFLSGGGWWRPHPFSLSAMPNTQFLRITVKRDGDDTDAMARLRIGTPVFLEGPYGAFTGAARTQPGVLLIAGGIGITPLRALMEELSGRRNEVVLLYRARSWDQVVFKDEIDSLMRSRHASVHYLVGQRRPDRQDDLFSPQSIERMVPDIDRRDVYVCGPESMIRHVQRSVRALGIPRKQIHAERFTF